MLLNTPVTSYWREKSNGVPQSKSRPMMLELNLSSKNGLRLESEAEEEEGNLLTNPPKPRPKLHHTVKPTSTSKVLERRGNELQPDEDPSGLTGDVEDDLEVPNEKDETESQVPSKRPRTQKTSTRHAVEAAREKVHQEIDGGDGDVELGDGRPGGYTWGLPDERKGSVRPKGA
ncbi:hypothetical protein EDD15DRAFT_2469802 [Pisolithus albus]|nr:hypothetical protein EDD15DRAFT_2469802 [Pisolithus albus]